MKHAIRIILLVVGSLSASVSSVYAQSQRKEIFDMTEQVEVRIQKSVENFLGQNSRAITTVYIKELDPTQSANSQSSQNKEAPNLNGTSWGVPGNYIPQQVEPISNTPSQVAIDLVEITIQVEKSVNETKRKEIQTIATRLLKGMKTQIKVLADLDPPMPKSEESARTPASVPSAMESLISKFGGAMPLFAALVIVFGLLAAFGLLGLMIRSSASSVIEGIKSTRTQIANSGSQTLHLTGDLGEPKPASSDPKITNAIARSSLPPLPLSGIEARRQLESIENYILKTPLLFVRTIGDEPEDMMGLKYLVAKVSTDSKTKLKELLGAEKILKASTFHAAAEIVGFDARGWIQRIIEKIEIRQLAGGSIVEQVLSSDESLLLSSASEGAIFEAAIRANNPAMWRVATEFISSDFLKKKSQTLDDENLKILLVSASVDQQSEVVQAAKELIESVRVSASESSVLSKTRLDSAEHFSRKLLPSFVDAILAKDLGEDDRIFETLVQTSPEFAQMLTEKIWTPSKLDQLSDETLKGVFDRLDGEKRAYLIYAFPTKHSERFQKFLGEGNSKKITLDIVTKLKTTADEKKRDSIKALAREFLDFLRVQALNGAITLKNEGKAVGINSGNQLPARKTAEAEIIDVETSQESSRKAS